MSSNAISFIVEVLGDFVAEPRLVVVVGHPGAGKTTLASYMCYYAMQRGEKCLYISFQEDGDRLYKQLYNIGLDFKRFEDLKQLTFIKLPVPAREDLVQSALEDLSKNVSEHRPRVLVVDSVTAMLSSVKGSARIRGYLQNFFWELQKTVEGSIVLIAEVPLDKEYAELGWIEFVADAILILKHRARMGLVERVLEIRKVRGRKLTYSEVYFTIDNERGMYFYKPIVLQEIKAPPRRRVMAVHHGDKVEFKEVASPPLAVYVEYPAGLTPWLPIAYALLIHMSRDGKTLFISYNTDETSFKTFLSWVLELYGADKVLINAILNRVSFVGLNPSAHTLHELVIHMLNAIDAVKPTAVYIHDVATAWTSAAVDPKEYATILYNFVFEVRSRGIDIIRIGSYVDSVFSSLNKLVSSHMIVISCTDPLCSDKVVHVTTPRDTHRMSWRELEEATKKLIQATKEQLS
uniref:KaiC domain-containing protein n=1 Tax=Ignisphaera aggregans TaxID=334771 RepID=A0A7J2U3Z7_9CREN